MRQASLITALVLLLVATSIIGQAVPVTASDAVCGEPLEIDYPIAVIMVGFQDDEETLARSALDNGSIQFVELGGGCEYVLKYSFIVIDGSGFIEETMKSYLETAYVDRGVPWWVSEYVNSTGVNVSVRWVELRSFYRFLYGLASSYLESARIWYRDILVIIGDIDGVSRQYWAETPYRYVRDGRLLLEGVRGWSGPLPLTFYDLTVIPKPRPEKDMPLYWLGRHVNYTSEPPLWDLRSQGRLADYIAGLALDHVKYRVVSMAVPSTWDDTPLRVVYKIIVVSFGDESVVEEVLSMMSVDEVVRLTKTLVPWIDVSIEVSVMGAWEFEGLQEYVGGLSPDDEGFVSLEYSMVAEKLLSHVSQLGTGKGFPEFEYVFFVLATSEPSRFVAGESFYFTGFSSGDWGATTWPGHGYRNYEGGLPRTIVHELGHSLGLAHSFAYFIEETEESGVRWLMDWASTVMGYDDAVIAGFLEEPGGGYVPDYYTVYREGLKYAGGIALYMAEHGIIDRDAAMELLRKAAVDPLEAAVEAMLTYYSATRGGEATVTVTETAPVTIVVTETTTTTVTSTETIRATTTLTLTETATLTIATTVATTMTTVSTVTESVTVTETRHYTMTTTVARPQETAAWRVLIGLVVVILVIVSVLVYLARLSTR